MIIERKFRNINSLLGSLFFVLFLSSSATIAQVKEGDAVFPMKITIDSQELTLNGTGMREMFFIDLYAGALYLNKKNNNPKAIANALETMNIKIKVVSSLVTQEKMKDGINEGFEKACNGNKEQFRKKID